MKSLTVLLLFLLGCFVQSKCPKLETESCLAPELNSYLSADKEMTYREQEVLYCNQNTTNSPQCQKFWSPKRKNYAFKLNHHYSMLNARKNHSLTLMDKKLPPTAKPESNRAFSLDIAVDSRCHHSWPYNPYHRIADCLTFILPALFNFFKLEFLPKRPPFGSAKIKLALIVDESTEMLCEFLNKKTNFEGVSQDLSPLDQCLLTDFQELIRSRYYYQCIKVSIFSSSVYWYKLSSQVFVQTKEFVWLNTQKDPWAAGSGFMNQVHPHYDQYLKEYRRLMLDGFCKYCALPPLYPGHNLVGSQRKQLVSLHNKQHLVLMLIRAPGTGRDIIQQKALVAAVRKSVRSVNSALALQKSENSYHVVPYTGTNESTCETISLFWHSKIIIAAHGAGIVNTVFSRPNTLLIEITPDKLQEVGVPWRMNSPFAHYMGISSHVIVVPHNTSAKSDGELQKVYSISLRPDHIDFVAALSHQFLSQEINNDVQYKNISTMV